MSDINMVLPTDPRDDWNLKQPVNASQQSSAPSSTQPPLGSILADPALLTSPTPKNMEVRPNAPAASDTFTSRLRGASGRIFNSNIPVGMWDATGNLASGAPSLQDIRRGSYGNDGWCHEGQLKDKDRRATLGRKGSAPKSPLVDGGRPELNGHSSSVVQETLQETSANTNSQQARPSISKDDKACTAAEPEAKGTGIKASDLDPALKEKTEPFDNGYQFPPKHTWSEATVIGLKAFWKFTWTPLGFFVVMYGLLVVAFGGMLFLLLCNAAPAMCNPDCNDINSPRRIWVEYDSQIVNALFCVTGFGLIPWRFRDLYFLMKYRLKKDQSALRRLAGIHRGWFRLPESSEIPVHIGPDNIDAEYSKLAPNSVPQPLPAMPDAPLTGVRAPPTPLWKMDFVIWMYVWNTFLQGALSGIMWGLNRYNRPAWTTGFLVAVACILAAAGGIMVFLEGKKVKKVEGVPVSEKDKEKLRKDREMGILHYNNLKDEKPKEEKPQGSHRMQGGRKRHSKNVDDDIELGRTENRRNASTVRG